MHVRRVLVSVGEKLRPRARVEALEGRVFLHAGHDHGGLPEDSGWDSHVLPTPGEAAPTQVNHANPSAWTTGNKTVLYIRTAYADTPTTEPQSLASAQDSMTRMDTFMRANSFGLTSFTTTFTDLVVLPQTKEYYTANGDGQLRRDALAAARAAGTAAGQDWDNTHYSLDAVRFSGGPGSYAGQAAVGGRGVWLKSNSSGVAAHEFGHNLALWHSNYWTPTDPQTVIGPGVNNEYGDSFDVMGSGGSSAHFNAWQKNVIGWIPDANVTTARQSGRYRLHAFDLGGSLDPALPYLVKFPKDADRDYTLEFRQGSGFTSNRWVMNGVGVHWDRWASSNRGSQLIDTNPASPDNRNDSHVVLGRTFSDEVSEAHVTPVARGTTTNAAGEALPYIDVQVNFADPDAGRSPTAAFIASAASVPQNTPVTFTATASDPDGDELAYHWDFGDRTFGGNSPAAIKSWGSPGEWRVRLTVSDMKGRSTSVSTVVRVGNPANANRISGWVADAAGNPVAGVRVGVAGSSTVQAYTDSDGTYTLTNLPSGGSYTLAATKAGWVFSEPAAPNPVSAAGNPTGIGFAAARVPYPVSGRVLDNGQPVPGAVVTGGGQTTTADDLGQYALDLPLGTHTLRAEKSGLVFAPETVTLDFAGVTRDIGTAGPGTGILREWWTGITGNSVSSLTNNANYPNNPAGSEVIGALNGGVFRSPIDFGDNYGTRMRGYYIPPTTGSHTFWVSGDSSAELYLSTDENPANKTRIAVADHTGLEQWDRSSAQRSAARSLVAGRAYYIEVLHKEGSGADHVAVGATLPNGTLERPIPYHRLLPFGAVPDVTPPGVTGAKFAHDANPPRLTLTFSEPVGASLGDADFAVTNLTTGEAAPGRSVRISYDPATNTATITFTDPAGLANGNYTATLTAAGVTDAAGNALPADYATAFFVLAGDINRDRLVNGSDFSVLAANFGKTGRSFVDGDLNGDGAVNGTDFSLLASNFGRSLPEPEVQPPLQVAAAPVGPTPAPLKSVPATPPPRRRVPVAPPRPTRRPAPAALPPTPNPRAAGARQVRA